MRAKDETELHNVLAMFQTHPPTAERIRHHCRASTNQSAPDQERITQRGKRV